MPLPLSRRLLPLALAITVAACGNKSTPTAPSTPTPTTTTKIIRIFGSMDYGAVQLGQTKTNTLTIVNDGNTALTFTGLNASGGLTAVLKVNGGSGTVPPGGQQAVPIVFTPASVTTYTGTISVSSDATSGGNSIAFTGAGTLDGIPIWTRSGTGNTVFDMPSHVGRVRIQATPPSSCQNFAVRRNGSLLVNVILGTCSVADVRTYDGTHLVSGGGVIEIVISEGVSWTFTEVR